MFALCLDYLTGRAVATAYNDRQGAEWPPHPARVFSALVATWAEQESLDSDEARAEHAALAWLESLPPPAIACDEGCARTVMTHYVPTNDVSLLPAKLDSAAGKQHEAAAALAEAESALATSPSDAKALKAAQKEVEKARKAVAKAQEKFLSTAADVYSEPASATQAGDAGKLLPAGRGRQPRSFPSLGLPQPLVHLCWPVALDETHRPALERLAARLMRIGHSSSLVHARWLSEAPAAEWVPDEMGELLLRVPGPGQLSRLQAAHEQHQGVEPRVLPFRAQRYRARDAAPKGKIDDLRHFGRRNWIVLQRCGGPLLPLTRGVDVARAVRAALMECADQPPHEVISGHKQDGAPSTSPHVAIVPLPHVGNRHADGGLRGLALLLPQQADKASEQALLRALGRWEQRSRQQQGLDAEDTPPLKLGLGDGIEIELERQLWGEARLRTLQASSWCQGSREWVSVTPVALDRNPGDLAHRDPAKRAEAWRAAAETIARACSLVGLPLPEAVTVLPSGTWPGGAKAARFPAFPPGDGKLRRMKVHARIRFAEPVTGPVLLGAGRFYGLGLFKPVTDDDGAISAEIRP
ncbi:CRISPR-associated protein Csb2 [Solimonas aquatica]|uniref:CRISPR-associated protein Csb2 n=1 Tax=Solimonas aquatica TaxID=489703 RepID=A0A1H9M9T1_9GAMM|nr:type I-U CRISPR-associated protein Csb2 [Solimonas aquatica]SER20229.1 CRISPR-associated protein Csb2 [Solimonas aquatica]